MTTTDRFVYVTYIQTSAEKLWAALTQPEFTRNYWHGTWQDCDWKVGASWKMISADGTLTDSGEVLECDPPRRLVLHWRNEFRPELKAEGYSRCTFELEPVGAAVKLTIVHAIDAPDSLFIQAVSGGWPRILSSLKSLLETGTPLAAEVLRPGSRK